MFDKSKIDDKKFERLCYMIAVEKFWDLWNFTPINWKGWDWWREFYLDLKNWDRWCWQCKNFDKLWDSQRIQIKNSLQRNIRNDWSKLKKRFLCLSIDLTDTIIQENLEIKHWEREFINKLKEENKWIEIVVRVASNFDSFCAKYPTINNYFFWDEKQQREAEIDMINSEDNREAKNQAEKDKKQINNIFLWWKKDDIDWSKMRYYKYNLQKIRCMDHKLIMDDINEIEESIDITDLDLKEYRDFKKDFQWSVSNYFSSFKPAREILDTSYRYILNEIWKQVWCVLKLWVDWKYNFNYNKYRDIYFMNIKNG